MPKLKYLYLCFLCLFSPFSFSGVTEWMDFELDGGHVKIPVAVSGVEGYAILDSGAQINSINSAFIQKNKLEFSIGRKIKIEGVYGTKTKKTYNKVPIKIFGSEFSLDRVVEGFIGHNSNQILLGAGFFANFVVQLDYPKKKIRLITRDAIDMDGLENLLVRFSQLIVEQPWIAESDINPLLVSPDGILALDGRVVLHPADTDEADLPRLAIRPYPQRYVDTWQSEDGNEFTIRPIRPEDEPMIVKFHETLSERTVQLRYFTPMNLRQRIEHERLTRIVFIDYDREMAFIVSAPRLDGKGPETLGVVRAVTDADNIRSEFSVVIRDDLQGEGLGRILMSKVIKYCKERGTLLLEGSTLPANKGMQGLAAKLGFTNVFNAEDEVVEMRMMLNEPTEEWQITRLHQ